ncbi:MAG: ATP-grasp domain-containing protein [Deltaproteobacteria bacterium]|nr:MAG: ATP-grasp domain-containing protein [Deltaproteobacteria bacterium]
MLNVVFVAPYFGANMIHCVRALSDLEGVRLGLISAEPQERVPPSLRDRSVGHFRVDDPLDPGQLAMATRAFQREWGQVDRLLGYLEQLQVPLAQARDACGVPGMTEATARRFRDKNLMKSTLRDAGLPVARQALIRSASDARHFAAEVGYPIVLKPVDGLGSRNTQRASSEPELYRALNRLVPSFSAPIQAEEFVTGSEFTFETVSIGGEPVWSSSTAYLPGPLSVIENPWMQYCVLLPRETDDPHVTAFKTLNAAALQALGMVDGLSHMEWFRRSDGSVVIGEVGARPPGVNIMRMNGIAHGVDLWAAWAKLMVHQTWQVAPRKLAVGCAFLRGQGAGRVVREVRGLQEARQALGDRWVDAQLPRVGQPISEGYEGEGWVIVAHPTTEGAVDALRTLVTKTRIVRG